MPTSVRESGRPVSHLGTHLLLGLTLLGAGLALGYAMLTYNGFDLVVNASVVQTRTDPATDFAIVVNAVLAPLGAICILLLIGSWLAFKRGLVTALAFVFVGGAGWLSSTIGKQVVHRPRPSAEHMLDLVSENGLDSYPSGHTAIAIALAWSLGLIVARPGRSRRLTIGIGLAFAVIVGLSRVYLGVHYPTDVIGSFLIATGGVFLAFSAWTVAARLATPMPRARVATHPAGHGPHDRDE